MWIFFSLGKSVNLCFLATELKHTPKYTTVLSQKPNDLDN